jgi:acyl-CoA synthetase (AMP-forming)/AMP-acid ligase II
VPGLYLAPLIIDFDIDVLAARAYVTVIKRAAMKIFAAEFTDLIFPLRIAVVGEGGRNEEQDQQETHWCLREGLQIVLRRGPAHRRQHRQAAGAAAQGLSEAFPVLLVAVVGAPDPIRGEIAEAFIVSRSGISAGPKLAGEIQAFVRDRLAAYQYSRAVEFVDSLPMTATGKVMRRELRERAMNAGRG